MSTFSGHEAGVLHAVPNAAGNLIITGSRGYVVFVPSFIFLSHPPFLAALFDVLTPLQGIHPFLGYPDWPMYQG